MKLTVVDVVVSLVQALLCTGALQKVKMTVYIVEKVIVESQDDCKYSGEALLCTMALQKVKMTVYIVENLSEL